MRKLMTVLIDVAMWSTHSQPAQPRPLPQAEKAYPNESCAQYYRRDNGAAVAAGLAAGALIAGTIASQAQPAAPPRPGVVDPQVAAHCARKYSSYDPPTGTFLAANGMRYVCTYP